MAVTIPVNKPIASVVLTRAGKAAVAAVHGLDVAEDGLSVTFRGDFTKEQDRVLAGIVLAHDWAAIKQAQAAREARKRQDALTDPKTLTLEQRVTRLESLLDAE